MDCYPEYKHHIHPNHQHYSNSAASSNHPYYPGNYGASAMRYGHAHPAYGEVGQQQSYYEGYPRYNPGQLHQQQQHHHHGNYPNSFNGHYGSVREGYHANSEGTGQFYYQNAHQTTAGYYGNHTYDSYRNASSSYQYHYGGGAYGHQPPPATTPTATPPQQQQQQYYSSSYNNEQFNNRYYPTPPPSAPPRDSYSHAHPATDGQSSSSYAPSIENESSEKLNSNERLSIEADKSSSNDPVALSSPSSPAIKQSAESVENAEIEKKPEVQQTESEKSTPPHDSAPPIKSEKPNEENASEGVKVDENLDSEEKEQKMAKHENEHLQSTSFNENRVGGVGVDHNQHHQCNETLTKANEANSQESAAASDVENSAIATGELKNTHFSELSISTERRRNEKKNSFIYFALSVVAQLSSFR